MTREDDELTRLRQDFPSWDIARAPTLSGGPGGWLATRDRVLSTEEMCEGLVHTLTGATVGVLRHGLAEQQRSEKCLSREPV